jgi:hypothetical protein
MELLGVAPRTFIINLNRVRFSNIALTFVSA